MTAYINLTRNEYPRHEGDMEIHPNDSYANVEWVDRPTYDYKMQRCGEGWPVEIDGTWYMTWVVRDATQVEIDEMNKPFDSFNINIMEHFTSVDRETSTAIIEVTNEQTT